MTNYSGYSQDLRRQPDRQDSGVDLAVGDLRAAGQRRAAVRGGRWRDLGRGGDGAGRALVLAAAGAAARFETLGCQNNKISGTKDF